MIFFCQKRTHSRYEPDHLITLSGGKAPLTYQAFCKVIDKAGKPAAPVEMPNEDLPVADLVDSTESDDCYSIPTLAELGYPPIPADKPTPWKGGETEALKIMREYLAQKKKV